MLDINRGLTTGASMFSKVMNPPRVRFAGAWIWIGKFVTFLDSLCPKITITMKGRYPLKVHPWTPLFTWAAMKSFHAKWYLTPAPERLKTAAVAGIAGMVMGMLGLPREVGR